MSDSWQGEGLEVFGEAVAYHEAGHAVAACALGFPFELVTIVPDSSLSMAGGVKSEGLRESAVLMIGQREGKVDWAITVLFAGAVAQARLTGEEFDRVWFSAGCQFDREGVDRIAVGIARTHHVAFERVLGRVLSQVADAERLIEERWAAVEAVAGALLERLTLTQADVERIVASSENEGRA